MGQSKSQKTNKTPTKNQQNETQNTTPVAAKPDSKEIMKEEMREKKPDPEKTLLQNMNNHDSDASPFDRPSDDEFHGDMMSEESVMRKLHKLKKNRKLFRHPRTHDLRTE
jgi:hypothetical protein